MTPTSPEIKLPQSPAPEYQPSISEQPLKGDLDETFNTETNKAVEQMKPESKKFFGCLFDRIKSSDVVQNITDRYQVWRDERLAQRGQEAIDRTDLKRQQEEQQAEQARRGGEQSQAQFSHYEEIMARQGGVSEEAREKATADQLKCDLLYEGHKDQAQEISGQIEDIRSTQEGYLKKAQEVRGRLDGRLEAKMSVNNKSIEEYGQKETRVDLQIDSNGADLKKTIKEEDDLGALLKTAGKEGWASNLKESIKEIGKKRAHLEEVIDALTRERDSIRAKISKLEGKNSDLSTKREKILPAKQRQSEAPKSTESASPEKEEEEVVNPLEGVGSEQNSAPDRQSSELSEPKTEAIKPEIDRIELRPSTTRRGEIVITTADGGTCKLTNNDSDLGPCIIEINPKGEPEIKRLGQLTDEDLKPFQVVSSERLEAMGLGAEIVARMASLEEEKLRDKFLLGNFTFDWNKMVGKKSGLQIEIPRYTSPIAES
ncbi:MAG: hypothetical protein NTY61_01470, partial [Candidatus Parcubacteria bacterium]|nr:hypothetical protein [Candidatus Parcubacteria bacterium]